MPPIPIRAAQANDLPQVVAVHQRAFKGFHMTLLGPRFLAGYYQTVLDYPDSIFLAAVVDEQMLGFGAGFVNPSRFYALLQARKRTLALAAATHLVLRPHLWRRTVSSLRRAQMLTDSGDQPHLVELASIGVSPAAQGRGVGKALTLAFLDAARQRQATEVMLTTDAPGCRETVIDGVNGFLVPPRNVDALVAAMERFVQQPELIASMGQASRKTAEERFDAHKINQRILEIIGLQIPKARRAL